MTDPIVEAQARAHAATEQLVAFCRQLQETLARYEKMLKLVGGIERARIEKLVEPRICLREGCGRTVEPVFCDAFLCLPECRPHHYCACGCHKPQLP